MEGVLGTLLPTEWERRRLVGLEARDGAAALGHIKDA